MPCPTSFTNTAVPLTFTTYDGSGEAVEPDIYDFGNGNSFGGYRFWMVNVPFPNGNDDYENPSIWASNNGINWIVPTGLTNPITSPVDLPLGADSDPCITYDPSLGKLRVYYRYVPYNGNNLICMIESSDGINWINNQTVLDTGSPVVAGDKVLMPQVLYNPISKSYVMWGIAHSGIGGTFYGLRRYTSSDGVTWTSQPDATFVIKPTIVPWHINIKRDGNRLIGVLAAQVGGGVNQLYYLESPDLDGTTFTVESPLLLGKTGTTSWDGLSLYQSCLMRVDGQFILWYTGYNTINSYTAYRLGRAVGQLSRSAA